MRSLLLSALIVTGLAAPAMAEAPKQRIVTLGGAVTEIVFALGAGDVIAGVDDSSIYPAAVHKLPHVGYYRSVSAEGVLSLRPTLVLASVEAGPPQALEQIKAAGVTVVVAPAALSVDAAKTRIQLVAKALGRESKGQELTAAIDAKVRGLDMKGAGRVLFLFGHGRGTPQAAGRDTAADAMLRLVGAVNVVSEYTGYKPLTAEAAIAASPDVVVTTTGALAGVGGAEALWALPGLATTPAAKAKKLVVLDDLYLLGFGPRVGDAAVELAKAVR